MKAIPQSIVLGLSCLAIGAWLPIAAAAEPVEIREGVHFEKNVMIPTDDGGSGEDRLLQWPDHAASTAHRALSSLRSQPGPGTRA